MGPGIVLFLQHIQLVSQLGSQRGKEEREREAHHGRIKGYNHIPISMNTTTRSRLTSLFYDSSIIVLKMSMSAIMGKRARAYGRNKWLDLDSVDRLELLVQVQAGQQQEQELQE